MRATPEPANDFTAITTFAVSRLHNQNGNLKKDIRKIADDKRVCLGAGVGGVLAGSAGVGALSRFSPPNSPTKEKGWFEWAFGGVLGRVSGDRRSEKMTFDPQEPILAETGHLPGEIPRGAGPMSPPAPPEKLPAAEGAYNT